MKNIFFFLMGMFPFLTQAQTDHYSATVEGMGCAYCANGVETKLKTWKAVQNIKIELSTGSVQFDLPADQPKTPEDLAQLIGKAGYTARKIDIQRAEGKTESYEAGVSKSGNFMLANFEVKGACGMCKERIESATMKVDGVKHAIWNEEAQSLQVEFDPKATSEADIQSAVARSGHDTPMFKAPDSVYKKLPDCCQYRAN